MNDEQKRAEVKRIYTMATMILHTLDRAPDYKDLTMEQALDLARTAHSLAEAIMAPSVNVVVEGRDRL